MNERSAIGVHMGRIQVRILNLRSSGGNLFVALFEWTSRRREGGEREEGRGEAGNSATIDLLIIRQLLTVFPCELRKYIASFGEDRTTFDEIPFENVRLMYDTFVFEDTRAH